MRFVAMSAVVLLIAGCAGKMDYVRPSSTFPVGANSVVIEKSREAVWNATVPELGKNFFVINNLDKSSGLINISYSGDPEKYVDCGRVSSYVKNARGERTYEFAGSKAQERYEVMIPAGLFMVDRRMSLEGRVNLVFEEISPTSTRVTANTKYVLQRQSTARHIANNVPSSSSDSISFNSGSSGFFPAGADGRATECLSTGLLEKQVLSAAK
jgi:hypothetical protein